MGSRHAADIEENSVFVLVADFLVGNGIRRASTFDRYRVDDLHGLYRSPLSFPQSHDQIATGHVRFRGRRPAGAGSGKAMPARLGAVCSPTS